MFRHVSTLATAALALAYLAGCTDAPSSAQQGCSLATLEGNYIYAYDGFNVTGPTTTDRLPFASAGHETYHGDGTVSGIATTSSNGVVTTAAYSGTYTVAANCTGTTSLVDENDVATHYAIVIQQNGLLVGYVGTDPNVVTAGYESRRTGTQGACTTGTLHGSYIHADDGFATGGGTSTQRSPIAQAGVDVFKGDGTVSGSATISANGDVAHLDYDGSYVVDGSCAGRITSTGSDQQPLDALIYVDPSGDQLAFVRIGANVVNAGYEARQ